MDISKRRWSMAAIGLIVAIGVVSGMVLAGQGLLADTSPVDASQVAHDEQSGLLGDEVIFETIVDEDNWTLTAVRVGEQTAVGVGFDVTSVEGIQAYVEVVNNIGMDAFSEVDAVPALVTFARPVPFDEFVLLMEASGAEVVSYQIRVIQSDGYRATIGGSPDPDGTILNPHTATSLVENQKRSGRTADVPGVFEAEVVVDSDAYQTLTLSDTVFLVDVMRAVGAAVARDQGMLVVEMQDVDLLRPYWHMEDLGIVEAEGL